jgi:hypothetical protein
VVSSICAAIGLLLTSVGLMVNACGLSRSRRTADLQALQKFSEDANKREAALWDEDEASRLHAYNEFLNFLELYACAYNNGLIIGRGSQEIVRHKLEDSFIELDAANDWHSHIAAALDRTTTLAEFTKFVSRHRDEIDQRKAERNRMYTTNVASSRLSTTYSSAVTEAEELLTILREVKEFASSKEAFFDEPSFQDLITKRRAKLQCLLSLLN